MAAKKKAADASDIIGKRVKGTFEILYMQGGKWILYSTRYNGVSVSVDVDELEAQGKRVRVIKTSDKTGHHQDED